jgi:hypothetical protein
MRPSMRRLSWTQVILVLLWTRSFALSSPSSTELRACPWSRRRTYRKPRAAVVDGNGRAARRQPSSREGMMAANIEGDRDHNVCMAMRRAGLQDWSFCHKADPSRTPHRADLEYDELLWAHVSEMALYRCRSCGQRYRYSYHEFNTWGDDWDYSEEWVRWYPITDIETDLLRRDINYELPKREHLAFGP